MNKNKTMAQIKGLLRDTWWLWLLFIIATFFMAFTLSRAFLLGLLVLPAMFLYFAYGRYDDDGNQIER